jgi:long-subunit fatty acid transport protein
MPQPASTNLFSNAQQQQQANYVQQPMQMNMPQQNYVPKLKNNVGAYGRTREPEAMLPEIFNDDEPFVESVKSAGK